MDLILWIGGGFEKTQERSQLSSEEATGFRFTRLSSWMMILGTVRLVSALGDYGSAFLDFSSSWHHPFREMARFFQEYPPAVLLGYGWPLILGLLLRKPTSRAFLVAGSVTFFILSLGGFLNLLAAVFMRTGDPLVAIGSFAVSRALFLHGNLAASIRGLMGVVQLILELMTAVYAWGLAQSLRTDAKSKPVEEAASRRGLYGRLAIYVSLAFIVLNVRQPVWSAYLTILNQSNLIREFVLKNDVKPASSRHSGLLAYPSPPADGDLALSLSYALRLAASNRLPEAKQTYLRIISKVESMRPGPEDAESVKQLLAQALNELAWMLATCEDVQFREPEQALSCATKAVHLAGDEGNYWNTLGVAYFRLKNWNEATKALGRSMELRGDGQGDSYDWFFLAMIHATKNESEAGRRWYDRAVAWFNSNRRGDRELYRFQVEAAKALHIPEPPAPQMTIPRSFGEPVNAVAKLRKTRLAH
jgi:tetratricopeptide (TPR) repeat protein